MQLVCQYYLLFMLFGFLGWCLEVGCKLVTEHKFINRGFLIGPYCPIYGWGAVIMTILLKKYLDDPVTLFIMIILTCSILEYFTSYFLEKIFKMRWWDYSYRKFNINGRICLETMLPFGIFGMILMYFVIPFFWGLFSSLPNIVLYVISIILFVIYLVDNIFSFRAIHSISNVNKEVQKEHLFKKDNTEYITSLVKKKVLASKKRLEGRFIKAFPNLRTIELDKNKLLKKFKNKK